MALRTQGHHELTGAQQYWDEQAETFDVEPDHGLRDPAVRQAWADLVLPLLPSAPARIVDLGCGTGSLSLLTAGAGHQVRGLDVSPRMIEVAREKAESAGCAVRFDVADAARPPVDSGSVHVVLARHVLWVFDDPATVLSNWIALLRPGGRLILVEGRWSTGAGIAARECQALVRRHRREARVTMLRNAELWGREIEDERYLVFSSS